MPFLIIFVPAVDPGPDSQGGGLFLFLLLINILLNLPIDILSSFGIFRAARIHRIPMPWLAWIPGINLWTLACIADGHRKSTKKRRILRWMMLAYIILLLLFLLAYLSPVGMSEIFYRIPPAVELIATAVGIMGITVTYVSLREFYDACGVDDPTSYMVLGLLFSIPTPFFILRATEYY